VAQLLTDMAVEHDISVDTPHHVKKGPADPGNADSGRGASALKDAMRLVYTVNRMTKDEAEALGIGEITRRHLIRVDDAKLNLVPMRDTRWFKLVSVNIGNATALYPHGDNVQTVEPWTPPDMFSDFSIQTLHEILDDIEKGLEDGNRYSDAPKAGERAAWRVIEEHCPGKGEKLARGIVKKWIETGLLFKKQYENPVTRKEVSGLWVNNKKRPSLPDEQPSFGFAEGV
jgi:hypothetical protein